MSFGFKSTLKNGLFTLLVVLTIFSFGRDMSQISDRLSDCGRVGGVFVGVDEKRLRVISRPELVDEVNFADQLRSEFNPLGEPARYGVAPVLQPVVVV
jgi:hypothetical protein